MCCSREVANSWTRLRDWTELNWMCPKLLKAVPLLAQMVKSLPAVWETCIRSLSWEDTLEKEMATTPVYLPGKSHGWLPSMGSQRVRHDWTTSLSLFHLGIIPCSSFCSLHSSFLSPEPRCWRSWTRYNRLQLRSKMSIQKIAYIKREQKVVSLFVSFCKEKHQRK